MSKIKFNSPLPVLQILEYCEELISRIPQEVTVGERVFFFLFIGIKDLSSDIFFLAQNERHRSTPTLTRSLLEKFIDFVLVTKDIENLQPLILKAYKEQKKKIECLLNTDGIKEGDRTSLNSLLRTTEEEIESRKNYKTLTVKDKMSKVELGDMYNSFYNDLCGYSHNDLLNMQRLYVKSYENDVLTLETSSTEQKNYKIHLEMIEAILVDTINNIAKHTCLDCSDRFHVIPRLFKEV